MKYQIMSIELITKYLKTIPAKTRDEKRKYFINKYSMDSNISFKELENEIRALMALSYLQKEKSLKELLDDLEKTLNE